MKQFWLLLSLCCFSWISWLTKAQAQNPYACDSLKITCADNSKIPIRYFSAPKTCPENCPLCYAIAKENWLSVEAQLKKEVKALKRIPEPFGNVRSWLLSHRFVNFVLPPESNAIGPKEAFLQIGFQVPHMTLAWNAGFKFKNGRKLQKQFWKLNTFETDAKIFSRINQLAENFQILLRSDSLQLPQPLLPDQNYFAAWFGTKNISPETYQETSALIKNNPTEALKTFTQNKDAIGLILLMGHQNLAIRYLALQGIKEIRAQNTLPYLLRLAEVLQNPVKTSPETNILYMNFCEELVSVISILSDCGFNRCPFAHFPPQHYLKSGLPTWQRKPDPLNGQGIGSYVIPL